MKQKTVVESSKKLGIRSAVDGTKVKLCNRK